MERQDAGIPPWIKALVAMALSAILANGIFVWVSLSGRRDLVRKDYYQAGLEQDSRLTRRALAADHRVDLIEQGGVWKVSAARRTAFADPLPGDTGASQPVSRPSLEGARCRVSFQRPENGGEDRVAELDWVGGTASEGNWQGPALPLRKGRWNILIEWERGGEVFMESAFARNAGAGGLGRE